MRLHERGQEGCRSKNDVTHIHIADHCRIWSSQCKGRKGTVQGSMNEKQLEHASHAESITARTRARAKQAPSAGTQNAPTEVYIPLLNQKEKVNRTDKHKSGLICCTSHLVTPLGTHTLNSGGSKAKHTMDSQKNRARCTLKAAPYTAPYRKLHLSDIHLLP